MYLALDHRLIDASPLQQTVCERGTQVRVQFLENCVYVLPKE
jgi:hypothetical protein